MNESTNPSANGTSSKPRPHLVGWTIESPGRGTLTLILTCVVTIFLCTWVVIHPRVDKRKKIRLVHKLVLCLKAVMAPELIAVEGAQEWMQVRRMVKRCANLTNGEFKSIHGFFVGMFAIRYRTEKGTKVLWPNQYIWLLEQGLIKWEDRDAWGLSLENIRDKSNADSTAKLFALLQVFWFVAQSILRVIHHFPLAPLESMTLSYIPLFAVTYFFWWVKPKDIEIPAEVNLPAMSETQSEILDAMALSNDFDSEGAPQQDSLQVVWLLTPRIFEKEAKDRARQEAKERDHEVSELAMQRKKTAIQATWEYAHLHFQPHEPRVLAHWDPGLYLSKLWPLTCMFGISFGALHLISWNAIFPTTVELWLWRSSAITSIVTMLVFMQYEMVVLRWGGLLTLLSIISPALYLISRLVMLAGVVAAFRASDPRIYDTYVLSTYWIHAI